MNKEEIRKLAEQSNTFSGEITDIIHELTDETVHAVNAMKEVSIIVNAQKESVEKTSKKFEGIDKAIENIKETKRYFLNDKGLVYDSVDLKIIDNKIALNEELFKNDALVFEDLNIKTLTLKNSINENYIKLNFENFPYLGIWSKPTG